MQRIISLFESGVGEATIMEALNGISPCTPKENVPELELEDIVLSDIDRFLANFNDFPSQDEPTDQTTFFTFSWNTLS